MKSSRANIKDQPYNFEAISDQDDYEVVNV